MFHGHSRLAFSQWRRKLPCMRELADFHPILKAWFRERFGAPSPCQRAAWPAIRQGGPVLIAAPTGSGKTLAAFLCAIDRLLWQASEDQLDDRVQVLYVSPLRALSHDVHENLEAPLDQMMTGLRALHPTAPAIRAAVRTGDTPALARAAMRRRPPHILVTTPESLYVLLTSASGREALGGVETVIVDEIHALVGSKRGAHLALSLERLSACTGREPQRIGLSATQRPVERVAGFLRGAASGRALCTVVDLGHARKWDLQLCLPSAPLGAVLSTQAQAEIHDQIADLIRAHRATLVFVNTRRLAERVSRALHERLANADDVSPPRVLAHHGSLSRTQRLEAERLFKDGRIDALVATASLELGIDVGEVDLVVQIGSPRSLSTLLQRIGRAGHQLDGVPRGRIFPQTRDDLIECVALLDMVVRDELDALPETPAARDVLAQQVVAECAAGPCEEDALFALVRAAEPYSHLARSDFEAILSMLAEGFTTTRGRRSAYLHRDRVNARLHARPGARLVALTCGGAIPDQGDYDVILEPEGQIIGTVNEDFAIDSVPGNVFQLGTSNWRVLRVERQSMRVADAGGAAPNMPFWFGEAPGRTTALSVAVSRLRSDAASALANGAHLDSLRDSLLKIPGVPRQAAGEAADYLAAAFGMLGCMPTVQTLVLERFFDDAGGMQLVLHAPLGVRINRAFGLGLRKRFCKQFNFELQAAATDNAVVISLGAIHSFELETVWSYLNPASVRSVVTQALLDAPMFPVRWRWVTTCALAVQRFRQGRKVPPQIQRMAAEDLVALVFPDQIACQENISGPREIPDHPLVDQVLDDCLNEVMDIEGLIGVLAGIRSGAIRTEVRDLAEPSPFAAEILAANPYAFLDDAPLEERRTRAVQPRRHVDPNDAPLIGRIELEAANRVVAALRPSACTPEALHDGLVLAGFLHETELFGMLGLPAPEKGENISGDLFPEFAWPMAVQTLLREGRVARLLLPDGQPCWVATERLAEMTCLYGTTARVAGAAPPAHLATFDGERIDALVGILKSRLEIEGPISVARLAAGFAVGEPEMLQALQVVEQQGFALRGEFTAPDQWCERRILARISRASVKHRRAPTTPAPLAALMRLLFERHGIAPGSGVGAVEETLVRLAGFTLPMALLESHLLPTRIAAFDGNALDTSSLSGEFSWFIRPGSSALVVVVPEETRAHWLPSLREAILRQRPDPATLPTPAASLLEAIAAQGTPFLREILSQGERSQTLQSLALLVRLGFVRADGFACLRSVFALSPAEMEKQDPIGVRTFERALARAGRFSTVDRSLANDNQLEETSERARTDTACGLLKTLLDRYGVLTRQMVQHEQLLPAWRELRAALRRMELSGEVVAGRFLAIPDGEQYATPDTVSVLERFRTDGTSGMNSAAVDSRLGSEFVMLSAMDPLNIPLLETDAEAVPRRPENFLLFRHGEVVATRMSGRVNVLRALDPRDINEVRARLLRQERIGYSLANLAR